MNLEFQEYRARKIVNVHRHVDSWFWNKYSAHPYVGCRSGCEFCYLRGNQYLGRRDPETFDTLIQVKTNAAELLRRELERLPPAVITCGDWQQPAEDRFGLSRAMLEILRQLGWPLFVVERSPLITRDVDLLTAIRQNSWAAVALSLSSVDARLKQAFEPRSPGLRRRWQTLETLARAGLIVGTTLMPVLPQLGDDAAGLAEVVQATRDHGGSFVLAGGLTMAGVQAERTFAAAGRLGAEAEAGMRQFYEGGEGHPASGPPRAYAARLGLLVRELCARFGLRDRLPRYVAAGPLAVNQRLAEQLFTKTYDLELEQADETRIWAYRKAAWTVDEWESSLAELYQGQGERGLRTLPGIGSTIASDLAGWLRALISESAPSSNVGRSRSAP